MSFTLDPENDKKTCDGCGCVLPLSSGHVCAHIIHAEIYAARNPGAPPPVSKQQENK